MWKTSVTCTTICSQIDRGIPFSVYPSSAPHPGRYTYINEKRYSRSFKNLPSVGISVEDLLVTEVSREATDHFLALSIPDDTAQTLSYSEAPRLL